ncbi:MAG TPA: (4Fe-4S)-binding protein [bacterium]|nr:(4Fe-4S)-binding protein [bacterium]
MKKHYTHGGVTILWQSALCIHCGNCARGLPQVFNPAKRPWIEPAAATGEEIKNQVAQCPSGALSIVETGADGLP